MSSKGESRSLSDLKNQLEELGPILPGKLSLQYIRCGKKNCHCNDSSQPVKHGPYYQISYSLNGKSSSFFVKEHQVETAKNYLRNYEKMKHIINQFLEKQVRQVRENGL